MGKSSARLQGLRSKGGCAAGAQRVGEVKDVKGVDEVRVWGWKETSSRGN